MMMMMMMMMMHAVEHWHGMVEAAGEDYLLIYGMPLWQNIAGGRTLGSGRLQPRTKLSGCSTCRILSHSCIWNIFVRSLPLCPKWAAAPWHTGAKSLVSTQRNCRTSCGQKLGSRRRATQCGLWAWICPKPLTGRTGMHCALRCVIVAFLTISFRFRS